MGSANFKKLLSMADVSSIVDCALLDKAMGAPNSGVEGMLALFGSSNP